MDYERVTNLHWIIAVITTITFAQTVNELRFQDDFLSGELIQIQISNKSFHVFNHL